MLGLGVVGTIIVFYSSCGLYGEFEGKDDRSVNGETGRRNGKVFL